MKYKICFVSKITGHKGCGEPTDKRLALEWLEWLEKHWLELNHWLEPVLL